MSAYSSGFDANENYNTNSNNNTGKKKKKKDDNNDNNDNSSKLSINERIAQRAEFGLMNFTQIYLEGLLATLVRYRDQALLPYKQKIDDIIENVTQMELSQSSTFAFGYSKNERRLEYIGLTIRKVTNEQDQAVFDYSIYTYSYEEPLPKVDPADSQKQGNAQHWTLDSFKPSWPFGGSKEEKKNAEKSKRQHGGDGKHGQSQQGSYYGGNYGGNYGSSHGNNYGSNQGSNYGSSHGGNSGTSYGSNYGTSHGTSHGTSYESHRESHQESKPRESFSELSTQDKMKALKEGFVNELAKKGIHIQALSNFTN